MNAIVRQPPSAGPSMLSPAKVADYVQKLEAQLGRRVARAAVLPDGGIEVTLEGAATAARNPADLVSMDED